MEWIQTITEWAKTLFEQTGFRPAALPLAFLLGLVSAVASACCTLPVLGAIVGYSGTQKRSGHRSNLLAALFFMLGTVMALVVLGSVAGFIGQVAQSVLGKYWKIFAGLIAIFVGLAALNLLPFKLSQRGASKNKSKPEGLVGAAVVGFIMGGGVSVCSLACNPGIYIVVSCDYVRGFLWLIGYQGQKSRGCYKNHRRSPSYCCGLLFSFNALS
ncbi:MAG: cytochrome c biogenesis CcdA family protein [Planctomycetota bacterium]|jgi:cytochrome c biogenesis protein CcdA